MYSKITFKTTDSVKIDNRINKTPLYTTVKTVIPGAANPKNSETSTLFIRVFTPVKNRSFQNSETVIKLDLLDNNEPRTFRTTVRVGYRTILAVFRFPACKIAIFIKTLFKLKFPNNSTDIYDLEMNLKKTGNACYKLG
jgi:hypothetical protein